MTWDVYVQRIAEAVGAPPADIVHIPTDVLVKAAPKRAGIVGENFQFNNIFDNMAARRDLNFCYTIPWIEGVRWMTAWLMSNHRLENSDLDPFDDRIITAWRHSGASFLDSFVE